uniref:Cell death-inducing p53-target protein 1 n=1 Tax=Taeniopygia guttata TaxID=59729 RepID=A0A674HRR8_TAEGU
MWFPCPCPGCGLSSQHAGKGAAVPGSLCPHVTLGGSRRGPRGNDTSRKRSQLKAWHCSLPWGEFGFLMAQRRMWLKGLSPSSCYLLSPFPASLAADCVSFQRVSPQWWDSPRGFLSPLLSSDPPHMSHPHSRGSCPPTCPRMALGPTCHQVSPARGWGTGGGDQQQHVFPGALGSGGTQEGVWAAIWSLQRGSLGWGGGHRACSRAGPKSVLKGWCCSRMGASPKRIWPLLPCTKVLTCLCFSFTAGYYPPPGPHPHMGYYPAPGPYPSPGGHTATVLVPPGAATTTVTVLQGEIFQGAPVQTVCPHCQQAITTKISYEIGLMSFLLGFFCCFVGCDLCCCLIPCLFDDFKDVTHTCPNCKAYIYTYKRMC